MTDKRTIKNFTSHIRISATACFGGTLEKEGLCGEYFDGFISDEPDDGETWEKAESDMIEKTVTKLIEKSGVNTT